jgi:hypothetical protein
MEMQAIGPPATRRDMVPDTFSFYDPTVFPRWALELATAALHWVQEAFTLADLLNVHRLSHRIPTHEVSHGRPCHPAASANHNQATIIHSWYPMHSVDGRT